MEIVLTAAVACIITLVIVIIAAGLMGQEKKIKYEIETLYSVSDEQFRRSMGNLLPPPMTDGNAVTTLINGNQIFPSMLDAIRKARALNPPPALLYQLRNEAIAALALADARPVQTRAMGPTPLVQQLRFDRALTLYARLDARGAVLVADDVGNAVWRLTANAPSDAAPQEPPR